MTTDRDVLRFIGMGAAAAIVGAAMPPLLAVTADARAAKPTIAIALLGICSGLMWIAVAAWWHRRRTLLAVDLIVITAVMLSFCSTIARHPGRNWDYVNAYELPAQQIAAGVDPYELGETTNPPTWPQLVGVTASVLHASVLAGAPAEELWFWMFYGYQTLQLALLAALLALAYQVARQGRQDPAPALLTSAAALVLCSPLQETLQLNQINLLLLVLTMAAVLIADRSAVAAGLAAGFGGAIKLYPFGAVLLWLLRRRLRPAVVTVVVAVAVALPGWAGWTLYARYLQQFERPAVVRDASLHAVASNTTRAVASAFGVAESTAAPASLMVWLALDGLLLAWVAWRQHTRAGSRWEVIAALPLLFPLGWVHHYLMALPLGIARFSASGFASQAAVIGGLLALVLPAFDTFPLGLARPIGTILLIAGGSRADEAEPS